MHYRDFIRALSFISAILMGLFVFLLGAKLILSQCDKNASGDCITLLDAVELASEISILRQKLAEERKALTLTCKEEEDVEIESAEGAVEISIEEWNAGDVNVLKGCWQLEYDYTMYYNRDASRPVDLIEWRFCLSEYGEQAVQNLKFEDESICMNQPLFYNFIDIHGQAELELSDHQDVPCTRRGKPSGTVIERNLRCKLDETAQFARCRSRTYENDEWSQFGDYSIILRKQP